MSFTLEQNSNDSSFDIRDLIERYEELESELEDTFEALEGSKLTFEGFVDFVKNDYSAAHANELYEEAKEFLILQEFLSDVKGYGGDEQWRGDWYPVTFINDNDFVEAMKELVQDIGDLPRTIPTYLEIDWDKTAENLKVDYSSIELKDMDGSETTFWYR